MGNGDSRNKTIEGDGSSSYGGRSSYKRKRSNEEESDLETIMMKGDAKLLEKALSSKVTIITSENMKNLIMVAAMNGLDQSIMLLLPFYLTLPNAQETKEGTKAFFLDCSSRAEVMRHFFTSRVFISLVDLIDQNLLPFSNKSELEALFSEMKICGNDDQNTKDEKETRKNKNMIELRGCSDIICKLYDSNNQEEREEILRCAAGSGDDYTLQCLLLSGRGQMGHYWDIMKKIAKENQHITSMLYLEGIEHGNFFPYKNLSEFRILFGTSAQCPKLP